MENGNLQIKHSQWKEMHLASDFEVVVALAQSIGAGSDEDREVAILQR